MTCHLRGKDEYWQVLYLAGACDSIYKVPPGAGASRGFSRGFGFGGWGRVEILESLFFWGKRGGATFRSFV